MQPYTAVDLLNAMRADLGDGAPSHTGTPSHPDMPSQPDAPSCARSRWAHVRMMASLWRRPLRSDRPEAAAA